VGDVNALAIHAVSLKRREVGIAVVGEQVYDMVRAFGYIRLSIA